jgi:NAD(P)-dependent dehydrogenase (short-subunit alcohol dehydrogenase family)
MASLPSNDLRPRALVIGNSGGIGAALQRGLSSEGYIVTGLSRSRDAEGSSQDGLTIDLTCERSIEAAAANLRAEPPFSMILIATGLLHDAEVVPEKAIRDLDQASLTRLFAVNTIGPALVVKHFAPLLPKRGRCIFGALSARVGSISDNRLGGWYGYRASKAALNMLIRTLAIELARTNPDAICVALHPGTVDTGLSKPFQKGVSGDRLFSTDQAAAQLLDVLHRLEPAQTGRCLAWDGAEIAP